MSYLNDYLHFAKSMPTQYQELKQGDVRQEGDEKRETPQAELGATIHVRNWTYRGGFRSGGTHKLVISTTWSPVKSLLGHSILASDLITHEYRRPLV